MDFFITQSPADDQFPIMHSGSQLREQPLSRRIEPLLPKPDLPTVGMTGKNKVELSVT